MTVIFNESSFFGVYIASRSSWIVGYRRWQVIANKRANKHVLARQLIVGHRSYAAILREDEANSSASQNRIEVGLKVESCVHTFCAQRNEAYRNGNAPSDSFAHTKFLDSVTENHFFSLSCVLYPHVRATPNYTENPYFDRAWPQHLYLSPSSPLLQHLRIPSGFSVEDTPLVTFRRVDLLLDRAELEGLYAARSGPDAPPLFSAEQFWSLSPEYYVRDLFLNGNYGTLIVSTGGHWTVTLMSAFHDEGARAGGIDGVLEFFDASMHRWAEDVQGILDEWERRGKRWGFGWRRERKRVVVRAYLPGHEDCHNERAPWKEWRPFVWNWYNWGNIWEFNKIFEVRVCASVCFAALTVDGWIARP